MLPVELILLYMVYLGMGPGACKISRPLDAGFILFQFWVGLISVVPVLTSVPPQLADACVIHGNTASVAYSSGLSDNPEDP